MLKLTPAYLMMGGTLVPGLVALAFFLRAGVPDSVELEWRFVPDRPFFTETESTVRSRSIGAMIDQKATYIFRWTPKHEDDRGRWVIERRLERVKIQSDFGDSTELVYDSARPEDAGDEIFARVYRDLLGWQSTLTLAQDYRVAELVVPPRPAGNLPSELDRFYREDTHREMIESLFCWVAGRRVRVGDTWSAERTGKLMVLDSRNTYTFTYEGHDGPLDRIQASVVMQALVPDPQAVATPIKNVDLKTGLAAQGYAWFNRDRGRLQRVELYLDIKGKVTLDDGTTNAGTLPTRTVTTITDTPPE